MSFSERQDVAWRSVAWRLMVFVVEYLTTQTGGATVTNRFLMVFVVEYLTTKTGGATVIKRFEH